MGVDYTPDDDDMADAVLEEADQLTEWEMEFIDSVRASLARDTLSQAQHDKLAEIYERLC